ncbi:MAG: hypothetical protein CK425_02415 [Parachlamydia sp.]|nr:MAG: hypothetical protein CK425_02415 [Parachlamydia sp.]
MPSIKETYASKDFLHHSEMKSVLKQVVKTKNIQATDIKLSPNFSVRDRTSRTQRVAIFFERFALSVKFFFNRSSKRKFNAAIVKIDDAFYLLNKVKTEPRKTESEHKIPTAPKIDPIKEAEAEVESLLKEQEDLQIKISAKMAELDDLQKIDDGYTLKNGLELNAKKNELEAKQTKLPLLKEHLEDVKAYKAPTGFLSYWKPDPAAEKIKKFDSLFNLSEIPKAIPMIEGEIEKLERDISQLSEECVNVEKEVNEQKELSEKLAEKSKVIASSIQGLQSRSAELAKSLNTAKELLDKLKNTPKPEPVKEEPVKEEPKYDFGTAKENLVYVLAQMEKSIRASEGTPEEIETNWQRHQRYLAKGKQTDKLVMSGIQDEEIAKEKSAMAVRILATALAEPENNKKLCDAVAGFLDSLLKLDENIPLRERKNISDLVRFVFGLDEKTKTPRMDEDYRLRGLACINGCVLVMAQYFFDEDSLRSDMKKIKYLESNYGLVRAVARAIGKIAFNSKKDELVKAVKQVPVLKMSKEQADKVNNLIEVLEPVVFKILGGNPNSPTPLKRKIHAATRKFANEDFKKFMDLIDFEKLPSTSEMTDACCELFKNFERNLENTK